MAEPSDDPYAKFASSTQTVSDDPYAKFAPTKTNAPGILESLGRGAAEGATFGFDDMLGMDKERREASRQANPWAHFMGEIAGGVLPMIGTGGLGAAAKGAGLLARGARGVAAVMAPGEIASTAQAVGQGIKLGGVYGGLSGAGHADAKDTDTLGESLIKRGTGALKGATVGSVIGAPLGAAGHGVYRGAQEIGTLLSRATAETADAGKGALVTATRSLEKDRTTPQQVIDAIRAEFPDDSSTAGLNRRFWGDIKNKQPITADQVETAVRMSMAGESPASISAALSPTGKGSGPGEASVRTLLDELAQRHLGPLNLVDRTAMVRPGAGENTQMSMRAAAATPGEPVSIAREELLERQVGAQGRIGQLFDRMLGSPDYEAVAAKHATDLQNAGSRAYGQAFAHEAPFDLNPIFSRWEAKFGNMNGPIPKGVMAALDDLRTTQPVLDQAGNLVKNSGVVNKAPPMNLESFMFARQGLSDAIGQAKTSGNKNLARNLTQLHDDLTNEVARTNPAWAEANKIWRDGKAAEEAMEAGARMTTRLNASNRENLAEFTSARQDAAKAAKALRDANKPVNAAQRKNPQYQPTAQESAAIDTAQAALDAAMSRQDLFKVGLVRSLSDMLANQGETHNLTKQLLLPGAQKMLRQVLGKDADQFFNTVRAEQAMHRTYSSQFGSQTTPLKEAVQEQNWAPRFEASMLNPLSWANPAIRLAQEYAARTINARRNTDLMKLYTETDPLKQIEALRAMQTLHTMRSNAGNLYGKPAVGLAGAIPEAVVGGETISPLTPAKVRQP